MRSLSGIIEGNPVVLKVEVTSAATLLVKDSGCTVPKQIPGAAGFTTGSNLFTVKVAGREKSTPVQPP